MSAAPTETFIIGIKRGADPSVTLADIFQKAGITNFVSPNPRMAKAELTADERNALDQFATHIHIERPIPHY